MNWLKTMILNWLLGEKWQKEIVKMIIDKSDLKWSVTEAIAKQVDTILDPDKDSWHISRIQQRVETGISVITKEIKNNAIGACTNVMFEKVNSEEFLDSIVKRLKDKQL